MNFEQTSLHKDPSEIAPSPVEQEADSELVLDYVDIIAKEVKLRSLPQGGDGDLPARLTEGTIAIITNSLREAHELFRSNPATDEELRAEVDAWINEHRLAVMSAPQRDDTEVPESSATIQAEAGEVSFPKYKGVDMRLLSNENVENALNGLRLFDKTVVAIGSEVYQSNPLSAGGMYEALMNKFNNSASRVIAGPLSSRLKSADQYEQFSRDMESIKMPEMPPNRSIHRLYLERDWKNEGREYAAWYPKDIPFENLVEGEMKDLYEMIKSYDWSRRKEVLSRWGLDGIELK